MKLISFIKISSSCITINIFSLFEQYSGTYLYAINVFSVIFLYESMKSPMMKSLNLFISFCKSFSLFVFAQNIVGECIGWQLQMRRYKLWLHFSDCWVRPNTSNHLCLPSLDWPKEINKIPGSKYWPITRRKTKMIRRVGANPAIWKFQPEFITPHLKLPSYIVNNASRSEVCNKYGRLLSETIRPFRNYNVKYFSKKSKSENNFIFCSDLNEVRKYFFIKRGWVFHASMVI